MSFVPVSKVSSFNTVYWKPEVIGASAIGTYVEKSIETNKFNPFQETLYRLIQDDGTHVIVKGRSKVDNNDPVSLRVNRDLEKLSFGAYVEVKYVADKPSKNKGFAAFKLIQVSEDKDKAEQGAAVLAEYQKQDEDPLQGVEF